MKNIQNTTHGSNANPINPANPIVTPCVTLGELIATLHLGDKPHEIPTPKVLRETAGDSIAAKDRCIVYANGFAVYGNGSGRTMVWLPDCLSFTYFFNLMKDSEMGDEIKQTCKLPDGLLESEPWPIAVTLIGDHRVEDNVMKRQGDRKKNKSLIRGDNEEGEMLDEMEDREDSLAKAYSWCDGRFGENPEDAYIRKETIREMLETMTTKQRQAFILYYRDGYTQQEIADMMGVDQTTIRDHLRGALRKVKKIYC